MFAQARLKLTLWYLVIIMLVSGLFSVAIFQVLSREVHRFALLQQQRFQVMMQNPDGQLVPGITLNTLIEAPEPDLEIELLSRIKVILLIINGLILGASGIFAFLLAGKTLEPIQEMMEDQQRFISDASHELKTPLTAVRTALEVALRDKRLKLAEAKQVMKDSLDELHILQTMTQSLLRSSGKTELPVESPTEIDGQELIKKTVKKVTPLAKKKHITLDVKTVPFTVRGVEAQLLEVLVNLLDNAIKYSGTGTTVKVESSLKRRSVSIAITDQGIGMIQADLDHVFDRFYRVDDSRSKNEDHGYGLGLAIAQRIIEDHRGSIKVVSQLGEGSTFTVQLPR